MILLRSVLMGRLQAFFFLSLPASFVLFFLQGNCCFRSSLHLPYTAKASTRLDWKIERRGRTRIYSLPSCCWPSFPDEEDPLPYRSSAPILSGLDAMAADNFALLKNRSFALLTNATGKDRKLNNILDLMVKNRVRPALLLEPEHGIYGSADAY